MEFLTTRHPHRRIGIGLILSWAALWMVGCAATRNFTPEVDPNSLDGTSFVHYLGTVPVVTVEEGCRAILLIADGQENFGTHQARYDELLRRGTIRSAWNLKADRLLDKGTLGYMAVQVCQADRGINSLLLGSWGLGDRRYALNDAVAAGLMLFDSEFRPVRGGELLSVLSRIDDLMAKKGLYQSTAHDVDSPQDFLDQPTP